MDNLPRSDLAPRAAASILLVRDAPLEVLMVRRRAGIIFSSKWVFPGGVVDAQDASDDWLPYIVGADSLDAAERSFRITACRELFEEADVFIGEVAGPVAAKIHGPGYFDRIKVAESRIPLDALIPFAHWITPEGVGKRFDTHFYLCRAPVDEHVKIDGREIVSAEWAKPQDIIARARDGERSIMFPTLLNLMRLAESVDVDSALAAAAQRPRFTVMPKIERRGDAKFLLIPAMAGYGITEQQFDEE
jgi:8-oxo-dGTP pyrophosphatase MutT (NUDIX family)